MPRNDDHLGSGLKALFGDNVEELIDSIQNNTYSVDSDSKINISIDKIRPNPYQPRRTFDEKALNELAESIKEHGVFTPVLVRPSLSGYELIAGERRLKASRLAGRTEIPAIIVDFDDKAMMEISLLENIQREDLNVIEEANGYRQLIEKLNYTQEQLAERIGKSREHVANTLRLLKLPRKVQQMVEAGQLTMGQVRPLITMESEAEAVKLAERIVAEGLSVREIERLVRHRKNNVSVEPVTIDRATLEVQKNLQHRLQTKVRITPRTINISYSDTEDLNRILDLLGYNSEED
ncbi:MAG: ParB/RepB/Spo0J family partition protein [Erysipelotrichaceae bacterium]|nr:ParB/RepB/Spo0J family partition protein [Erysipelotrichaceae bacterium]